MKHFLTFFLAVAVIATLYAQTPGSVDKSYGNHNGAEIISGARTLNFSSAIQSDDKLIAGGNSGNNLTLSRYNKDGFPDSAFGTNGSTTIVFDNSVYDEGYGNGWTSLAIQPDGRIVAMGLGNGFNNDGITTDILLARFLPNGTLDETFGDQGKVTSALNYFDIPSAVGLQPDGKIVVAGYAYDDLDYANIRLVVSRYDTDGSLDKSFGSGSGFVTYETYSPVAYAVIVQSDGKIIAGGGTDVNRYFFMIRYLPDGTIDNSFGNNGTVTTYFDNGASGIYISSLALDGTGNIIAAGNTQNFAAISQMAVARYLPDGTLDNSFDEDGKKMIYFKGGRSYATNVFLPNADKIIIAGYAYTGDNPTFDFALAALNSKDGSLDSSFGTNGETTTDFGYNEQTFSAALQSDGKFILTASDLYDPRYIYLNARYYGYPVHVSLAVRIKRYLQNHSISWNGLPADDNIAYYSVEQSSSSTKGFMQVAKVSGRSNLRDYGTTNSSLLNGRNYYRVKAVSADGTIRYSEVVSADNTANTASVYPNPAKEYVTVQGLPATQTANISISDGSGNVKSKGVSNGAQYRSSLNNLQPGTYYVNITTGTKTETLKFVKE